MSEAGEHERFEPTKKQIEMALKQVNKGAEGKLKAAEGIDLGLLKDRDKNALVETLLHIPVFSEIPVDDKEFEKWEKENPQKAKLLRNTVNSVLQEYHIE